MTPQEREKAVNESKRAEISAQRDKDGAKLADQCNNGEINAEEYKAALDKMHEEYNAKLAEIPA